MSEEEDFFKKELVDIETCKTCSFFHKEVKFCDSFTEEVKEGEKFICGGYEKC